MECIVDGCGRPAHAAGLCYGHEQRKTRGQTINTPLNAYKGGKYGTAMSPTARLQELAIAFADSDSDDDKEFQRNWDNLRKNWARYIRRSDGEKIRAALAEMRRRGVKLGRPELLTVEKVEAVTREFATRKEAAQALGVSMSTVFRALRKVSKT